ncbi:hypothetical protein NAL32_15290 [Chryseobacterium sp. Ch-15]|uniref:Uncharacterized protein n=1 Tax=Chryseobacterium muglaense TaxID=2893752 RepID=A0A9Q3YRP7_9FLAO|nr:hypothetical protein [Chryseobacterium muglaense]MBD3905949.1 hypothetical protein [Chryseobacterium muglaense]MCC9035034.1 hypothetical protein [Chryseobacterium muglaense]MCM2555747.1 hypothetical protein [Chryseobacterium muglaense]
MKSKEELKKLFENGDKPTQENFWEWQDSYWHKDEKLLTENTGGYKIKGSVPDLTALHLMNSMTEGDVYNLLDTGDNYVYVLDLNNTGEAGWDKLSGIVDLSSINLQTVLDNGGTASFNNGIQTAFYAMTQGGFQAQTSNKTGNGSIGLQSNGEFTIGRSGKMVNMTSNGLTYGQDYSYDFIDRSLVDKRYVDSKAVGDSIDFHIPSGVGGLASYNILGNYAIVDFDLHVDTAEGLQILTTENSHGFGGFTKLFAVETISGGEVRYIRIKGGGNGQGIFIGKAFNADDDFEFYLKEVIVAPFAGAVVDP